MHRHTPGLAPDKEKKREPIKEDLAVTHKEPDDFFGPEFKNINFFDNDRLAKDSTEKPGMETSPISDTEAKEKPDTANPTADKKVEGKHSGNDEDSSETEDMWGREKKRRPSK